MSNGAVRVLTKVLVSKKRLAVIVNIGYASIIKKCQRENYSSPKFQEDQNELGIATAEDAQRSFGRNVRSKIR